MKYILIILSVFCFSISFSQPITQRSSTAITVQDGNLFAQNSFRPAVFPDTTVANSVTTLDSCGKIIFTYDVNGLWQRSCNPKRWVRILRQGDVASTPWGSITGTLSSQTDLQNALNLKLNISDTASMLSHYLRIVDTTNKWVQDIYLRHDSLFKFKNGTETFIDTLNGGGGGTVTIVSGTTNRITVANPTTTPVIDIAGTYVGQTSITTLGTIGTGTWNGTVIGPTFGGTGQSTVTTGDLLYGSASNTWSKLADVATGNALISGGIGTAPSWGKIGLTTHVSGILPVANGGTGTATPSLTQGNGILISGTWPNNTIKADTSVLATQYDLTQIPIPGLNSVLATGNTASNKNMELDRNASSPGTLNIRLFNSDTASEQSIATFDASARRGKAVIRLTASQHSAKEVQFDDYVNVGSSYVVLDTLKSWVIGVVSDTALQNARGFRIIDVRNGNLSAINIDTFGRVGLIGIETPTAYLHLPAYTGSIYPFKITPDVTPVNINSGAIHNAGTLLKYIDNAGTEWNLNNEIATAPNGSLSGSGPYTLNPSFTFLNNTSVGLLMTPAVSGSLTATGSVANQANLFLFNGDASGRVGIDVRDNNYNQQAGFWVDNADNTKLKIASRGGKTIDFQAGSGDFGTWAPQMQLTTAGNILITNLKTGSTAPTPSGTTKMVITDANGQLSFDNIPSGSGITSINSQTGASITMAAGTSGSDFAVSASSNTITYNLPDAGTSARGVITTTSQTLGGKKTFNDGAIVTFPSAGSGTSLVVSGDRSLAAAPGISGVGLQLASFTYTNTEASTTESGGQNFHLINTPTLTSSNAVTYSGDVSTIRFVGAPLAGGSSTISHPWNIIANDVNYFQTLSMGLNEQSGDVTLGNGSIPIYTGTGGNTFTLPSLATHPGKTYFIKNGGSGNLTLSRSGSDNLWDTSSVTTITISAGGAVIVSAGSSFWYIQKTE